MIKQIQDENDTRKKNIFLDKEGKAFCEIVYNTQKKRIFKKIMSPFSSAAIDKATEDTIFVGDC